MVVPRVSVDGGEPLARQSGDVRRCAARRVAGRRAPTLACRKWRLAHPERVRWFDTDNRRYRVDIDTPEDLERFAATHRPHADVAGQRWRARRPHERRHRAVSTPSLRLTRRAPARGHCWWRAGSALAASRWPSRRAWPAAFALVALWLLALGAAATVATARRHARAGCARWRCARSLRSRRSACGRLRTAAALPALLVASLGWAALTALASGVVRSLRLAQARDAGAADRRR